MRAPVCRIRGRRHGRRHAPAALGRDPEAPARLACGRRGTALTRAGGQCYAAPPRRAREDRRQRMPARKLQKREVSYLPGALMELCTDTENRSTGLQQQGRLLPRQRAPGPCAPVPEPPEITGTHRRAGCSAVAASLLNRRRLCAQTRVKNLYSPEIASSPHPGSRFQGSETAPSGLLFLFCITPL